MREHGGSRSVADRTAAGIVVRAATGTGVRAAARVAARIAVRAALIGVGAGCAGTAFGQSAPGPTAPGPTAPSPFTGDRGGSGQTPAATSGPANTATSLPSGPSSLPSAINAPIDNPLNVPDVRGVLPKAVDREGMGISLQILVLMTVLTLVPSILIMTTCFARILIVLALLRQALSTPQLPPSQVILGLALFMTLLIMGPTLGRINREALQPYLNQNMPQLTALDIAAGHMRQFMFAQIERSGNHEDIYLFQEYAAGKAMPAGQTLALGEVPTTTLIPAFILSELKTAFIMGFRIYLPFLVIDMVIATILISMGMMMLPPVLISLPFKILLFVIADGWRLIVQTLMYSFDNLGVVT